MNKRGFLVLAMLLPVALSFAQVSIDIPESKRRAAQPIAVVPLQGDNGDKIDYIISSDLYKSGYFQPISPKRFPSRPSSPAEIDYAQFSGVGANYIVLGRVLDRSRGLNTQFVLTQTGNQSVLFNEKIQANNARTVAHMAADLILQKLTGKKGAFATKVAYVLERPRGNSRHYALLVSDVDGANRYEIVSGSQPILSPSWSPDGSQIAYMTYSDNHSQIVVQGVSGKGRRVVVQENGTVSAPAWSPNGQQLAVSLSDTNGNMDVYLVDLGSGEKHRLTTHEAIDTEPFFSPNGSSLYFTSDRAGSPQIYRMSRDGGGIQRVVVGGGYSSNGEVSPDGKLMALTRQSGGGYQIGLYDLANDRFRALTSGRLDEGATFSPNGELLMYATKEGGRSVLKLVNLKGKEVQTLSESGGQLRDPAWAPDNR